MTGNQYNTKTCSIKRQVWLDTQTEVIGYQVTFYAGWDADGDTKECFWATTNGLCRDVWGYPGSWGTCRNMNLNHLGQIIKAIVDPGGGCIPYTDPVSGGSGCFTPPGTINVLSYEFVTDSPSGQYPGCYGSGDDSTHALWKTNAYTVNNPEQYQKHIQAPLILGVRDIQQHSTTGSCAALDLTNCNLMEEQVCDYNDANCIYTYQNYNPTGLTPLGSCTQIFSPTTSVTWTFCADGTRLTASSPYSSTVLENGSDIWWNIHRTYTCQTNAMYDFSGIQQRAKHIQNTFNDGDTMMTFQDYNPETNETTDYSVTLPPREDMEHCEKSCRVRVPVEDTQASLSGNTSMYRDTINSFREVLKPCNGDTCPVGPGETLIEGCQCTNYFLQTTSILQLMNDASKDMICSSSPP